MRLLYNTQIPRHIIIGPFGNSIIWAYVWLDSAIQMFEVSEHWGTWIKQLVLSRPSFPSCIATVVWHAQLKKLEFVKLIVRWLLGASVWKLLIYRLSLFWKLSEQTWFQGFFNTLNYHNLDFINNHNLTVWVIYYYYKPYVAFCSWF